MLNQTLLTNDLQKENRKKKKNDVNNLYCLKSVQIPSYFWSVFSCIWTEHK